MGEGGNISFNLSFWTYEPERDGQTDRQMDGQKASFRKKTKSTTTRRAPTVVELKSVTKISDRKSADSTNRLHSDADDAARRTRSYLTP